jgi:NitT/TauT family transport system ATP-binding protein
VPVLELRRVSKVFQVNSKTVMEILDNITLTFERGRIVALVGRSGCGKTTLLRIAHGLVHPTHGSVLVDGVTVTKPDHRRGLIFQQPNLLPWRTALENAAFGLRMRHAPRPVQRQIALENLQLVGLVGFEHHYPYQLSGGMQQRVGIARALAIDPEILLMDEPFGGLDAQTKEQLQEELLRIHGKTGKTIVFVTHDLDEAVYLSDRVVVLSSRPARVLETVPITIPRPREEPAIAKRRPEFGDIRYHIWTQLKAQAALATS